MRQIFLSRTNLIILTLSLLSSFVIFGNTLKGEFVYDDSLYIHSIQSFSETNFIKIWSSSLIPEAQGIGVYRPFSVFVFWLNYSIFSQNPIYFHLLNIILNGLVVFMVYKTSFQIFKNLRLSLFAASLFSVLPIHSEAVSNIKSFDDLMATLFGLLSLYFFIKVTPQKIKWRFVLASTFFFLLSVLSKETFFILPVMFLGLRLLLTKFQYFKSTLKIILPFVAIMIFYILVRYLVLGSYAFGSNAAYFIVNPLDKESFGIRIWTAFKIAFIYITKTFIPFNLSATYSYNHLALVDNPFASLEALGGIILLTLLLIGIIHPKVRSSWIGIASLIFLVPYFMVSKFIFMAGEILAERWMYFPSFGLVLLLASLISLISSKKRLLGFLIFSLLIIFYGTISLKRNEIWLSNYNLYTNMIKTAPDAFSGYYGLATWYLQKGNIDAGQTYLIKAQEIYPNHYPLWQQKAKVAILKKDYKLAEEYILKAIDLEGGAVASYLLLAEIYSRQSEFIKSLSLLNELVSRYPKVISSQQFRFIMSVDLVKTNHNKQAEEYLDFDSNLTRQEKLDLINRF